MRIAVISDTHMPRGARALPTRCVEELRGADAILHAGDFMRIEVLRTLEGLGPSVYGVHGNVDDEALRRMLPTARVVELGGARIGWATDPGRKRGRPPPPPFASKRRAPSWSATAHSPPTEPAANGFQTSNPAR